jgi:hypothetical protein
VFFWSPPPSPRPHHRRTAPIRPLLQHLLQIKAQGRHLVHCVCVTLWVFFAARRRRRAATMFDVHLQSNTNILALRLLAPAPPILHKQKRLALLTTINNNPIYSITP